MNRELKLTLRFTDEHPDFPGELRLIMDRWAYRLPSDSVYIGVLLRSALEEAGEQPGKVLEAFEVFNNLEPEEY
jgi:hypothetical protein